MTSRSKDKWSNDRFDAVDWEHLDLVLKNKQDMYRIWRSKQHSGFCGTRVQVGRYSGDPFPDERCPNCGRQESASHLMLCPDTSRAQLLGKNVAIWRHGCRKTIRLTQRSFIGFQNTYLCRGTSHFRRWDLCHLNLEHSQPARTLLDGGTSLWAIS